MKKIILVLNLGVALLLSGCETTASNVYEFIIDESYTEFIVMGTSADYPPYESPAVIDGEETLIGIDIEIGKLIAETLGKNLQVVNRGFDFLIEDLEAGKVDFVLAAMSPTEARAEKVDFSMIYYEASQVVLMASEDVAFYNSIEAMNVSTLKLGAQLGSIQADLLSEFFGNVQTQVVQSVTDLVLYLEEGQLDGVILEAPVAQGFVDSRDALGMSLFTIGDPEGGSAAAVQKGDSELLAVINSVIQSIIADGTLDDIVAQALLNE